MTTRRNFLRTMALTSAGVAMGSTSTLLNAKSYSQVVGANRKVNVAHIGIGNRGEQIIGDFAKTGRLNVVALCDVDMGAPHTQKVMGMFPNAKRYKDFRKMFDEMGNQIEAVTIATPDHSHFAIAMLAMSKGIHVYVEKPMCRTFMEAELMMDMARRHPEVVTQVGNQGHSEANYFQFKAWKEAGIIKDVTAITAHMNYPRRWHSWDPAARSYPKPAPVPPTLDWDTWLGTAYEHDYCPDFHNGQWRCWYEFGMGVLGDWGAHIIDTVHEFLDLGLPVEVNPLYLEGHNPFFYPMSSTILFRFPERKGMPALDITWYDGVDNIPAVPEGYGVSELDPNIPLVDGEKIRPLSLNPGKEIYSKELTFKGGSHGSTLSIIPDEKAAEMKDRLPDVPESPSNHYANFLLSVMGKEKPRSPFSVAAPLCQVFCLGVISQWTGQKIIFDRETRQITNNPLANQLLWGTMPREGWEDFYRL